MLRRKHCFLLPLAIFSTNLHSTSVKFEESNFIPRFDLSKSSLSLKKRSFISKIFNPHKALKNQFDTLEDLEKKLTTDFFAEQIGSLSNIEEHLLYKFYKNNPNDYKILSMLLSKKLIPEDLYEEQIKKLRSCKLQMQTEELGLY